jgi:putative flavoprotein involved in K+ transport
VIVATGPFQKPVIPALIPADAGVTQLHSAQYKNPGQLPAGGVLVIGAGSSGVQIADELHRAGRPVWLAVGRHSRPPRKYRGRDFVWWLDVLGKWALPAPTDRSHITIALSGARGGHTVDFRALAHDGVTLLGTVAGFAGGAVQIAPDLSANIAAGDADYLGILREADAYAARNGLDLPEEPAAHAIGADPACLTNPLGALNLRAAGITTVVWATGFAFDFGWIDCDVFDAAGAPRHTRGVSEVPGLHSSACPGCRVAPLRLSGACGTMPHTLPSILPRPFLPEDHRCPSTPVSARSTPGTLIPNRTSTTICARRSSPAGGRCLCAGKSRRTSIRAKACTRAMPLCRRARRWKTLHC